MPLANSQHMREVDPSVLKVPVTLQKKNRRSGMLPVYSLRWNAPLAAFHPAHADRGVLPGRENTPGRDVRVVRNSERRQARGRSRRREAFPVPPELTSTPGRRLFLLGSYRGKQTLAHCEKIKINCWTYVCQSSTEARPAIVEARVWKIKKPELVTIVVTRFVQFFGVGEIEGLGNARCDF